MSGRQHHNDGRSNAGTGKKKRGSVDNAKRLDAFSERAGNSSADWGGCDCSRLQAVVVAITGMGGAITIGLSRDMGAYSMTLLLDGDRQTMWFNGSADLDAELEDVLAVLGTMGV